MRDCIARQPRVAGLVGFAVSLLLGLYLFPIQASYSRCTGLRVGTLIALLLVLLPNYYLTIAKLLIYCRLTIALL